MAKAQRSSKSFKQTSKALMLFNDLHDYSGICINLYEKAVRFCSIPL